MQAEELRELVVSEAAALLHIDASIIDRQANLFDLGFHSLLVTQFVARIKLRIDVKLSVRDIFESPDIEGIINVLCSKCGTSR